MQQQLDSTTIIQLWNDPRLRLQEIPGMLALVQNLSLDPGNPDLAQLFLSHVESQQENARLGEGVDPFFSRYPLRGVFPSPQRGLIPLAGLPTGDTFSIPVSFLNRNLLVPGKTGAGKTNFLRGVVASVLYANATAVLFDHKGDAVDCETFGNEEAHWPIRILDVPEVPISALQVPEGMDVGAFCNKFAEFFCAMSDLYASVRLLRERLYVLFRIKREPSFSDLVDCVENTPTDNKYGRTAGYKEALLSALEFVELSFGACLGFSYSDSVERICSYPGLTVLRTHKLDDSMRIFYASIFFNREFERRSDHRNTGRQIVFILDDALQLIKGSSFREASERSNPISRWSMLGRARNMGWVFGAQNFAHVSAEFKNNCETIVACNSRGEDAWALARYMHLSSEQAAKLPTLTPGEVIVLSTGVWPHAVYGRVPEVK